MNYKLESSNQAVEIFGGRRVFLVKLGVKTPCGRVSIEHDTELAEIARSYNGKTKTSIPIYEVPLPEDASVPAGKKKRKNVSLSMGDAATALRNEIAFLQDKYLIASGNGRDWYVCESDANSLQADIDTQLRPHETALRNDLLDDKNYNAAQIKFEKALSEILKKMGCLDRFDKFADAFPSKEEISEGFFVEIQRWEPLPSLEEVMEKAGKDSSLAMQAEVVKALHKQLREDAPKATDELYGIIAKLLTMAEESTHGKPSDRDADLAMKHHERANKLLNLLGSIYKEESELIHFVELAFDFFGQAQGKTDQDDLDECVAIIRSDLRKNVTIAGCGEGAIALTHWLSPEQGLEAQIKKLRDRMALLMADPETNAEKIKKLNNREAALIDLWEYRLAKLRRLSPPDVAPDTLPDESPNGISEFGF